MKKILLIETYFINKYFLKNSHKNNLIKKNQFILNPEFRIEFFNLSHK